MTFAAHIASLRQADPLPQRITAVAILDAYGPDSVPLPYADRLAWYGTGGRYWRAMFAAMGLDDQADRVPDHNAMSWAYPLTAGEADTVWSALADLAALSDAYQADHGTAPVPAVDAARLIDRTTSWAERWDGWTDPLWKDKPSSSKPMRALLARARKQLDAWRKAEYGGGVAPAAPARKRSSAALVLLVVAGLAVVASGRRRRR